MEPELERTWQCEAHSSRQVAHLDRPPKECELCLRWPSHRLLPLVRQDARFPHNHIFQLEVSAPPSWVSSEPRVKFRCVVESKGTPGLPVKMLPCSSLLLVSGASGLRRDHAAPPWLNKEVQLLVPLGRGTASCKTPGSLLGRQGELVPYWQPAAYFLNHEWMQKS